MKDFAHVLWDKILVFVAVLVSTFNLQYVLRVSVIQQL